MLSRYKIISFWWTFLWRSWGWKDRHQGLCRLTFRWLYLCCARSLLWLCWFIIGFIFPVRLRITYLLSTLINTFITLSFIFSNSASLFWRYLLTSKSAASLASFSFRDLRYHRAKLRKGTEAVPVKWCTFIFGRFEWCC